ncbi:hypothetical protein [Ramlibacter sp.]|uniref:hypothetical protein n=1 Tax=Ramlibacter sp. TaxID=1917967 RepID=UPI00261A6AAE|nr:hypothetical protein [Ramlibacter sp.]MDB5958258.1 hypothetical protein [Ramlibacter sp.]
MTKQVISIQQYVDELNKEAQTKPWFKHGMKVVLYPPGAKPAQASGLDTEGGIQPLDFAQLEAEVKKKFDVQVPPHKP